MSDNRHPRRRDIRAVASALSLKYTSALRLIEQIELNPPMNTRTDYRNMTEFEIIEIFTTESKE